MENSMEVFHGKISLGDLMGNWANGDTQSDDVGYLNETSDASTGYISIEHGHETNEYLHSVNI